MFRSLICPSSGVCDYIVELPHWLFRSWFAVCWSLGAFRLGWYPGCRLKPSKWTLNWVCLLYGFTRCLLSHLRLFSIIIQNF